LIPFPLLKDVPRSDAMDFAQALIFDMGWIFFAAWGMVLTAASVIAFRGDIVAATGRPTSANHPQRTTN
jgi:hypothetical protein